MSYSQYKHHKENQVSASYGNTINAAGPRTPIKKKAYTPVRQRPYIDMTPPSQTLPKPTQDTPATPQRSQTQNPSQNVQTGQAADNPGTPQSQRHLHSPLLSPSRRMLDRANVARQQTQQPHQTLQQQQQQAKRQSDANQRMDTTFRINTLRSLR